LQIAPSKSTVGIKRQRTSRRPSTPRGALQGGRSPVRRRVGLFGLPKPLLELRLCVAGGRCLVISIKSSYGLNYLIHEQIILHMSKEWHVLSKLCAGRAVEILRARLVEQDVVVEGPFELPPLARLSSEDQTFVAAFVRCHGSIKQVEQLFGVSYPT